MLENVVGSGVVSVYALFRYEILREKVSHSSAKQKMEAIPRSSSDSSARFRFFFFFSSGNLREI